MTAATWVGVALLILGAAGSVTTAIYMRRMAKFFRKITTDQQRAIDGHTESIKNVGKSLAAHGEMIRALQVRGAPR